MANKITEDPRIDPRIKAVFGAIELGTGMHTMAMEVEDLDATVKHLQDNDVKLIGVG